MEWLVCGEWKRRRVYGKKKGFRGAQAQRAVSEGTSSNFVKENAQEMSQKATHRV